MIEYTTVLINFALMLVLVLPAALSLNLLGDIKIFGKGFMDLEDFTVSNLVLPIGSFFYVLFCTTRFGWGWKNYELEVNTGNGAKVPAWIRPYMTYVLPLIILAVLVMSVIPG